MSLKTVPTLLLGLSCSAGVAAFNLEQPLELGDQPREAGSLLIPYAFYNDSTELAAAMVYAQSGLWQPQVDLVLNGFVSSNGSYNLFFALQDVQLGEDSRWFFDSRNHYGNWGEIRSFSQGNPDYAGEHAGSHHSSDDNYILTEGTDVYYRARFRYLLPIGDGADNVVHTFRTRNGQAISEDAAGGRGWNPLSSGRTFVSLEPFYREQDLKVIDDFDLPDFTLQTAGINFGLEYNNTDWYKNSTRGNRTWFGAKRDWGAVDNDSRWTQIEFEFSQYFNLGPSDYAQQRVLAANVWTSDVPTWNSSHSASNGERVLHRPPVFAGSTLGGLDRQRGYATNRYNDRAAINYQLEYRVMPVHNVLNEVPLVNRLPIPWMQWVFFAEAGRVAETWSPAQLHRGMNITLGAGLRANVSGLVIRADVAGSDEGGQVQMFIGHTF